MCVITSPPVSLFLVDAFGQPKLLRESPLL
jgi:hypothetical protein